MISTVQVRPFFNNRIQYLFISSKCVSGANETNCALNVMSPTGLWNSPSPGLAGLFARSECISSAGKAGCSLVDSPGKIPPGLPGSRPNGSSPGEIASPLRGKLRPARLEESSRGSRTHGVYGPRVNPFDINQFCSNEIDIL